MRTVIVEATNGPMNWGKFLVARMDEAEWSRVSAVSGSPRPLLSDIGFGPDLPLYWVLDLQTREGAVFKMGGYPKADLEKHKIWVCPLFEPFLEWLYTAHRTISPHEDFLGALPQHVDLPDAPFAMQGYRRAGP